MKVKKLSILKDCLKNKIYNHKNIQIDISKEKCSKFFDYLLSIIDRKKLRN